MRRELLLFSVCQGQGVYPLDGIGVAALDSSALHGKRTPSH